jgi:CHASE1-domain containing sensor protein
LQSLGWRLIRLGMTSGQARPLKKFISLAVFLAVALISLGMAAFAFVAAQEASRFKFEATVDDAMSRIEGRLDLHLSLLRATQALFEASEGEVSRKEFRAFFDALDIENNFEGLRGVGFVTVAKTADQSMLVDGMTQLHGGRQAIRPAQTSEEYRAPVMLYESLESGRANNIGYDMFADPARRSAIEMALRSGQPRATARVVLGDGDGAQQPVPGFLVFASAGGGQAAMRSMGTGLVFVAFRTGDLFHAALGSTPLLPVNAEVFDGTVNDDNLFYRSPVPPADEYRNLLVTRNIVLAGRPWTIRFRPTAAFSEPTSPTVPVMLGLFGLLLAGAIALVARYQERAYSAVSSLHEATEKSLLEKDLMLQEMKHRIKNSIARVLAMARQTAAHATDIDEFSNSFAARLQAMAASQDMLTRSRWQKADLAELLQIELGQVFGKELPADLLGGPQVLLDETTTQALGLTFHELATNALKYGEAGNPAGTLKVRWMVAGNPRDKRLHLTWTESGNQAVQAPQKTGFGTKLIDMNITRELYGTIDRDYRASGLVVRISIPLEAATRKRK